MIEEICDTYYEAINWGLMEVRAWQRVSGAMAARLDTRAAERRPPEFRRLERELGSNSYFNGASTSDGPTCPSIPYLNGSVVWGIGPKSGAAARQMARTNQQRESVTKTWRRRASSQGTSRTSAEDARVGQFKRQYRDHRLEWMMR